jgi:hypothetical protein
MNDEPERHPERERDSDDVLLDELLDAAAEHLEPLPPGLIDDVERFVADRCRQRRRALGGITAAAAMVALLAACWVVVRALDPGRPLTPPPDGVAQHLPPVLVQDTSRDAEPVTVDVSPRTIAVPMETSHPKMTVVWLYQAVERQKPEPR